MISISAWQHIFAHVEREYSPDHQRGFQTLFYSKAGLNERDIQLLERRVFFDVRAGVAFKRQYYPLTEGRVVVAQGVPIPEPDKLGRGGRYLFHNLIIEARDWERISCFPFSIFAHNPFFTQLDAVLAQGDVTSGNIDSVSLEVLEFDEAQRIEFLSNNWDTDALVQIGLLALNAAQLTESRKRLALTGSVEEILNALELAFLLSTLESRKSCFFDTNFNARDFTRTPVWVAGFSAPPDSEYTSIDSASLGLYKIVPVDPQTPFEQWWLEKIRRREFREYIAQRDLVRAMDSLLQGTGTETEKIRIRAASSADLFSFSRANIRLLERLGEKRLPTPLQAELTEKIKNAFASAPERWWQVIFDGMSFQDAAEQLDHIFPYYPTPGKQEVNALRQLATRSEYQPLMWKVSFWERAQNPTAWDRTLKNMSPQDYAFVGTELLKFREIGPFDWFCKDKTDTWLYLFLPMLKSSEIVKTARYLISAHREDLLEALTPKVEKMSRAEQIDLKELIQAHADLAPKLWEKILTLTGNAR